METKLKKFFLETKAQGFTKPTNQHYKFQIAALEQLEVVVHRCSSKEVLLKNSQYLQENTCPGVSF